MKKVRFWEHGGMASQLIPMGLISSLSLPSKLSLSEWESSQLVLGGAGQVKGGFSLVPAPRCLFRDGEQR